MAQFTVRNLEDSVRNRLRDLARKHGRSMEEEVRAILRGAVAERSAERERLGSRLAARFAKVGIAEDIPELRGRTVEPPRLGR
ncbi:MAG: Arc family DNA-binding protein [Phycisphaeraceae bacterium]|nr:Arc family DNA-binding protein [Phycisphaeraceae bacterium]